MSGSNSQASTLYVMDRDAQIEPVYAILAGQLGCQLHSIETIGELNSLLETTALKRPSCLIIDLHHPDVDAPDAHRRLHHHRVHLPTVFVGTRPDATTIIEAFAAGSWAVILKPLDPSTLRNQVANALGHDRQWCEMERSYRRHSQILSSLTKRQRSVLEQVALGMPTKAIAKEHGVSQRLIESERSALVQAFEVNSTPQLTRLMGELKVLAQLWSGADSPQTPIPHWRARRANEPQGTGSTDASRDDRN